MPPQPAPPAQGSGRYQRSISGLVGAMIIVVLVVVAYAMLNWLNGANEPNKVNTVDYRAWAKSARTDGKLQGYAPASLPKGWRATSATYTPGNEAHLHIGLVAKGGYVGVEESLAPVEDLIGSAVDEAATRDGSATVGGTTWQVWRDSGGDYALVRQLSSRLTGRTETLLVGGSAPEADVRGIADALSVTGR